MTHVDLKIYLKIVAILSCFKALFVPAYRSTDFEVHRNWLAITHSLPISEWYTSNISIWTLDYPPLFAWMEKGLSYPARLFDEKMLDVHNLNYASSATITFQRFSVIVTDFVFLYAVYGFMKYFEKIDKKQDKSTDAPLKVMCLMLLFITNFCLFIVDHIHFQYNGILFGIMLLSMLKIYQNRIVQASLWFSILLCMKHIYLYVAPVYGVYLLKKCWDVANGDDVVDKKRGLTCAILNVMKLGSVVILVFSITFLPFIWMNQLGNVLTRLFPFKRGLCHAYWAPNFWALYNTLDKALFVVANRIVGFKNTSVQSGSASMTGGLVQEYNHSVLPSIRPGHTFVLTALFMLPAIKIAWQQRRGAVSFTRSVVLCAFASFMFGWHVHEKAVLIILVPFTLLSLNSKEEAGTFLFLSCTANTSLFPLLFTNPEFPLKYALCCLSLFIAFYLLPLYHKEPKNNSRKFPLLTSLETWYVIGLLFIEIYRSVVHVIVFKGSMEFLPLMMTSSYCGVGMLYTFVKMTINFK